MLEIDVEADTELGQRAIEAVDKYIRDHVSSALRGEKDWPISRAQIAGLWQIAMNEPTKVAEFAEHQRAKVQAKLQQGDKKPGGSGLEAKIAFWELVRNLCESKPPLWSLAQAREQALPAELRDDKQPPGTNLTKEQQAQRSEKRERRERWQRQWDLDHYPAFFQRFCIHYLYEISKRT